MLRYIWLTTTLLIGLTLLPGGGTNILAAEGFEVITTPELKEWLQADQKPFLAYTLSQVEFFEQRIPGSVCIPTEEMQNTRALPQDLNRPVVFYCKGPG